MNYKKYHNEPPIIFLDTNVVVEMANGLISNDKNHRGYKLFDCLKSAVSNKKIICPFLYQRNEYFKYFDNKKVEKCDDILLSLSKGKQVTIVIEKIFELQFKRMALLYLNLEKDKDEKFEIQGDDILNSEINSESKMEESLGLKIVVLLSGFLHPNQENIEKNLVKQFIKRREQIKKDKLTKQQVLSGEKRGRLFNLIKNDEEIIKFYNEEINPEGGFMEKESLKKTKLNILTYWNQVITKKGIKDDNYSILKSFVNSEYFLYLPIDYISSILFTELLCEDCEIKTTDGRDIESISIILPYSSIAIVDEEMKYYIHKTKLNEIFKVKVFSLKNSNKFIQIIKNL